MMMIVQYGFRHLIAWTKWVRVEMKKREAKIREAAMFGQKFQALFGSLIGRHFGILEMRWRGRLIRVFEVSRLREKMRVESLLVICGRITDKEIAGS